jgi:hypothetical protein
LDRRRLRRRLPLAPWRRPGQRLTRQLVCDVESLLIHQIQPWANTSNAKSRGRYSRPGMVICCQGENLHVQGCAATDRIPQHLENDA